MKVELRTGLDSYSRRARLAPALFAMTPMGLAVATWIPNVSLAWIASIGSVIGLTTLLSQLARDAGRTAQGRLAEDWGGLPSTLMMRHGDPGLNAETRRRYHAKLQQLMPGTILPTEAAQLLDPRRADDIYASCGDFLREQTRDRERFALVFEENVTYGFRRNLWAIKKLGAAAAFISVIACALRAYIGWRKTGEIAEFPTAAAVVSGVACLIWLVVVNKKWVYGAAQIYARTLLAACDQLPIA